MKQESIAGVALQQIFKPKIAAKEYPVLDTRPLSSVVSSSGAHPNKFDSIPLKDQDLVGLEDDPDFWNMDLDSDQASPPKKLDKTAGRFHAIRRATSVLPSDLRYYKNDIQTYLPGSCKRSRSCVSGSQTSSKWDL